MATQTADATPHEPQIEDERPHPWSDAPEWQESVCCWFLDRAGEVGGFLRWGAHPNAGFGRLNLFVFDVDQRFRRVDERVELDPDPAAATLDVGSARAGVGGDGVVTYTWDEAECSAALRFDGFYPPHGFGGAGDRNLQQGIYTGHLECSGRVTGTLRIGAATHEVDALAHRDRSWGPRRIDMVHTNRMFTGTMGPELSFSANVIQTVDGTANKVGFVVRDGVHTPVVDMEILPVIHLDGYSVESGRARLLLEGGEVLTIHAETIAGQLTPWDGYLCSDHISRAWCGDLTGFCDNELTNNPRLGTAPPPFLQFVDGGDGLSVHPSRSF